MLFNPQDCDTVLADQCSQRLLREASGLPSLCEWVRHVQRCNTGRYGCKSPFVTSRVPYVARGVAIIAA